MNVHRPRITVLVAGLALALVPALALARPGGPGPGRGGPGHGPDLERAIEQLDVDDETRQAAYAILDADRNERRALRSNLRERHESLRALMEDPSSDASTVLAEVDAVAELRTRMHRDHVQTLLAVRDALPVDARKAFLDSLRPGTGHDGKGHDGRRPGRRGEGAGRQGPPVD